MGKLTVLQKEEIKNKYSSCNLSYRELAEEYGVSWITIARLMNPSYAQKERVTKREHAKAVRSAHATKTFAPLTCHLEKDADIIEKLDSVDNRQGYIKALIRNDID